MPNKPTQQPIVGQSFEERAKSRLAELTAARDQVRQQLMAIENQMYALTDLLNPKPVAPNTPQNPDTPGTGTSTPDTPPGTI